MEAAPPDGVIGVVLLILKFFNVVVLLLLPVTVNIALVAFNVKVTSCRRIMLSARASFMAVAMVWAVFLLRWLSNVLLTFGAAMAAMAPMIMVTTISSIKVNPD